ncbi:hypothetical protein ACFLT7_06185 [candidate division KSB1 bacterium]
MDDQDDKMKTDRRTFLKSLAASSLLIPSALETVLGLDEGLKNPADFRPRLRNLTAPWWGFMDSYLWDYPHPQALDGIKPLVYGTGYASWGAWATINAALFASVSTYWEDEYFSASPAQYRTKAGRLETSIRLIAYALGYHTSGDWDGADGGRWGSEQVTDGWQEGYNNWHSPIWLTFLAEAAAALGNDLPSSLKARIDRAIIHDADVQCGLDLRNFDGNARDIGEGTSLESHSWKASLLTLARCLFPDHPHYDTWLKREIILWASSFAVPGDDELPDKIDGYRLKDIVRGSHLTPSFVGNHHGFTHPGYMTWPLLSRVTAREWAARYNNSLPQAAARHEKEVFQRLLGFYDSGRLVYPAGQDWPRWIYAQAYFLPVILHYRLRQGDDYPYLPLIANELMDTRRRDADASADGGQASGRLLPFYDDRAFEFHRYETDMVASAAIADLMLTRHPQTNDEKSSKNLLITQTTSTFEEPLCDLIYQKNNSRITAVSWRAHGGPVQITCLPLGSSHLAEWQGNGAPEFKLENLP